MVIFSIVLLLIVILGLVIYAIDQKQQHISHFETQQAKWTEKHDQLQLYCNDLKAIDTSTKKLKMDNIALIRKIDKIEHARDNLSACLAALEVDDTADRYITLEEECKNLAKKVVSLHRDNTEIKLKLDSYAEYEKRRQLASAQA